MVLALSLTVKNGVDRVRDLIKYHLRKGVDFVVAVDRGSDDGSWEELEALRGDRVLVRQDLGKGFGQSRVMTENVSIARRQGADWVINGDDDEFWVGKTTLKEEIEKEQGNFLRCSRYNFVPEGGTDVNGGYRYFHSRVKVVKPRKENSGGSTYLEWAHDKSIVKARDLRKVVAGNIRCEVKDREEKRAGGIEVWHFPVKRYEVFEKMVRGMEEGGWGEPRWAKWKRAEMEGRLREEFDREVSVEKALMEMEPESWKVVGGLEKELGT